METTGGYASRINGKNERHNGSIHNMVRAGHIDINQHRNKRCCAAEISAELYRWKLHSGLDNTSHHFEWYGKNTSINELRTFGCDIYPINSSSKKLDDWAHELSFVGYTNRRATMKWSDLHTNKIKYYSSSKFDEHNNKFRKGWSPSSEPVTGTTFYTLTTLCQSLVKNWVTILL